MRQILRALSATAACLVLNACSVATWGKVAQGVAAAGQAQGQSPPSTSAIGSAPDNLYKLSGIKRVDQDIYVTSDGIYVQTQYCYHYGYGEEAILKWDGPYSSSIIWADNTTCKFKSAAKK